jgi:hypothetical protein
MPFTSHSTSSVTATVFAFAPNQALQPTRPTLLRGAGQGAELGRLAAKTSLALLSIISTMYI